MKYLYQILFLLFFTFSCKKEENLIPLEDNQIIEGELYNYMRTVKSMNGDTTQDIIINLNINRGQVMGYSYSGYINDLLRNKSYKNDYQVNYKIYDSGKIQEINTNGTSNNEVVSSKYEFSYEGEVSYQKTKETVRVSGKDFIVYEVYESNNLTKCTKSYYIDEEGNKIDRIRYNNDSSSFFFNSHECYGGFNGNYFEYRYFPERGDTTIAEERIVTSYYIPNYHKMYYSHSSPRSYFPLDFKPNITLSKNERLEIIDSINNYLIEFRTYNDSLNEIEYFKAYN